MVFSTTNLFKSIPCPEGERCRLTNCIYGHDSSSSPKAGSHNEAAKVPPKCETGRPNETIEPASKKRRITYDTLADKPPSRADKIRAELASARSGSVTAKPAVSNQTTPIGELTRSSSLPKSVLPATCPPKTILSTPTRLPNKATSTTSTSASATKNVPGLKNRAALQPSKTESLNPRLIPNDPAGHTKRTLYLKHIHAEMQRLNDSYCGKAVEKRLCLDGMTVTQYALDDEEKVAREQPTVYANIIKNRIAALKKMDTEEWSKYVESKLPQDEAKQPEKAKKVITTGLTPAEEICVVRELVANQETLTAHGYIPTPPTVEEANEAAAAVEASRNYESCDRCAARFQVFPNRDEEGRLTSSGACQFHPLRKVFPPKTKADRETGPKEPYFPCCSQSVGSLGCTTHANHVFKTTNPARLAATLPFIVTPENIQPSSDRHGIVPQAVTFDCEMGYTTHGMELIRLTAIAWPIPTPLLDILVRPLGNVIDLNSRFSGVFAEHYQNSITYEEWLTRPETLKSDGLETTSLPIVENPQRARELLCSFLTPLTPLMGHAIENDLNAVRLCHPSIVDTIVLFPHPRKLPMRFGLKFLSQKYLERFIQTGGERGHDSMEDAVATGDLIRVSVGEKWKQLHNNGWSFLGNRLIHHPSPATGAVAVAGTKKRRKLEIDGTDEDEGTEDGAVEEAKTDANILGDSVLH